MVSGVRNCYIIGADMANGADTFDVIKDILKKDVLGDSDAHRLLLAGIVDLNSKFEKREKERKDSEEKNDKERKGSDAIKDAAQNKINDMVAKMWPVHRLTVGILVFFGSSVGALIWAIIIDKVNIVFHG